MMTPFERGINKKKVRHASHVRSETSFEQQLPELQSTRANFMGNVVAYVGSLILTDGGTQLCGLIVDKLVSKQGSGENFSCIHGESPFVVWSARLRGTL